MNEKKRVSYKTLYVAAKEEVMRLEALNLNLREEIEFLNRDVYKFKTAYHAALSERSLFAKLKAYLRGD